MACKIEVGSVGSMTYCKTPAGSPGGILLLDEGGGILLLDEGACFPFFS